MSTLFPYLAHLFLAVKVAKDVNGVAESMATHINGYRGHLPCPYASNAAKEAARSHKSKRNTPKTTTSMTGQKRPFQHSEAPSDHEDDASEPQQKKLCQSILRVFRGIDIPFTEEQKSAVKEQATRAIISTGPSFSLFEDLEMVKLMVMLRSTAPQVLPKSKAARTTWLDKCAGRVEEDLVATFRGWEVGLSYVNQLILVIILNWRQYRWLEVSEEELTGRSLREC
jgi:hypothetical protein